MALPTAGRAAFVAAECADDAVVGEEVLALLAEVERGEQTAFMNAADAAGGVVAGLISKSAACLLSSQQFRRGSRFSSTNFRRSATGALRMKSHWLAGH